MKADLKSMEVASILKEWLIIAHKSQVQASKELGIHPSVLSRQLKAKENIQPDKIQKFIKLYSPSKEEATRLEAILAAIQHDNQVTAWASEAHGLINFYGKDGILLELLNIWPEDREDKIKILIYANNLVKERNNAAKETVSSATTEDILKAHSVIIGRSEKNKK